MLRTINFNWCVKQKTKNIDIVRVNVHTVVVETLAFTEVLMSKDTKRPVVLLAGMCTNRK